MNASSKRGNNPETWDKILMLLDEKLQLGLLEHLKRVSSYHFEDNTLFIEPGDSKDCEYLKREPVLHQLKILAEDVSGVRTVKIKG